MSERLWEPGKLPPGMERFWEHLRTICKPVPGCGHTGLGEIGMKQGETSPSSLLSALAAGWLAGASWSPHQLHAWAGTLPPGHLTSGHLTRTSGSSRSSGRWLLHLCSRSNASREIPCSMLPRAALSPETPGWEAAGKTCPSSVLKPPRSLFPGVP